MLEWNETQDKLRLERKAKTNLRGRGRGATFPKPPFAPEQIQADARQPLDAVKLQDRRRLESRNLTGGLRGEGAVEGEGELASGARGERVGGASKGEKKAGQVTNDVAFVLRKLYTGGGLDVQQQGWKSLPMDLFNTLTLQLGTLSKVTFVLRARLGAWEHRAGGRARKERLSLS